MAEIKFNFYNVYKKYYRNINDFKTLIIYIEPKSDLYQLNYLYIELFTNFFFNKLESYIKCELLVGVKIDNYVYKSIKFKNKFNFFLIKIFNGLNYNHKIYNIIKF